MKRRNIYYGWFVVAACFILMLAVGETFWSFGVFFKPLETDFGWSRTIVSSGYTTFLVGYSISAMFSGRLADRYNPRPILLASAVIMGIGSYLCSQISDVTILRISFFVVGLGFGTLWSIPNSSVQRWFYGRPKAGLALSINLSGVGLGGLIYAPLLNYFILEYNWRFAFIAFGIISVVSTIVASLVIKPPPAVGEKSTVKAAAAQDRFPIRPAIHPVFIWLVIVSCTGGLAFQIVAVHLIPMATDAGISQSVAAAALGLMGGFSVPGRLIPGFFAHRINWQRMLGIALAGMALSFLWLIFLQTAWMLYSFVFFFGVFQGIRAVSQVGAIGDFFGMRYLGQLVGISSAAINATGAISPYIAGFIFDTTKSYTSAFIMAMAVLFIGAVIALTIKSPLAPTSPQPVKATSRT
ncbi:MAG: MFS transporter [Dehalococcoidales bacterium]|nr:MFS transporter [Dehalococcoidales bacterium]